MAFFFRKTYISACSLNICYYFCGMTPIYRNISDSFWDYFFNSARWSPPCVIRLSGVWIRKWRSFAGVHAPPALHTVRKLAQDPIKLPTIKSIFRLEIWTLIHIHLTQCYQNTNDHPASYVHCQLYREPSLISCKNDNTWPRINGVHVTVARVAPCI